MKNRRDSDRNRDRNRDRDRDQDQRHERDAKRKDVERKSKSDQRKKQIKIKKVSSNKLPRKKSGSRRFCKRQRTGKVFNPKGLKGYFTNLRAFAKSVTPTLNSR